MRKRAFSGPASTPSRQLPPLVTQSPAPYALILRPFPGEPGSRNLGCRARRDSRGVSAAQIATAHAAQPPSAPAPTVLPRPRVRPSPLPRPIPAPHPGGRGAVAPRQGPGQRPGGVWGNAPVSASSCATVRPRCAHPIPSAAGCGCEARWPRDRRWPGRRFQRRGRFCRTSCSRRRRERGSR